MRERSTWQGNGAATPRQAATQRQADIYKMNQEHPDASPIDYESGDPDSWAESWHGYGDVEAEYEGGHVKRNELNFAEFRDNTFKHKDSDNWHSGKGTYDNVKDGTGSFENTSGKSTGEKAGRTYEASGGQPATTSTIMAAGAPADRRDMAERKAKAVERITRAMLRTSNEKLVLDTAIGFMGMPDRVVVATLRALDSVSPDALSPENKTKRALACAKLSARLVGEESSDKVIESLASTLMTVDDPTLKSILKQVAAARVAQQGQEQGEEEGEQQAKTSQQQVTGQQQTTGQQVVQGQQQQGQQDQQGQQQQSQQEQAQQRFMQQQQGQQEQQGQQQDQAQQQAYGQQQQGQEAEEQGQEQGIPHMGHELPQAELQMLDQMLKEEMGQQGVPAGDDLTALFEAAPAPAAPVAPVMAAQGQGTNIDISFDEDDEMPVAPSGVAAAQVASTGDNELDALFGDNDEVVAQRQIRAAEQEQTAREGGFAVGRTASSKGARKIGQVQRPKAASVDQVLENIWDRT